MTATRAGQFDSNYGDCHVALPDNGIAHVGAVDHGTSDPPKYSILVKSETVELLEVLAPQVPIVTGGNHEYDHEYTDATLGATEEEVLDLYVEQSRRLHMQQREEAIQCYEEKLRPAMLLPFYEPTRIVLPNALYPPPLRRLETQPTSAPVFLSNESPIASTSTDEPFGRPFFYFIMPHGSEEDDECEGAFVGEEGLVDTWSNLLDEEVDHNDKNSQETYFDPAEYAQCEARYCYRPDLRTLPIPKFLMDDYEETILTSEYSSIPPSHLTKAADPQPTDLEIQSDTSFTFSHSETTEFLIPSYLWRPAEKQHVGAIHECTFLYDDSETEEDEEEILSDWNPSPGSTVLEAFSCYIAA